MADLSGFDATQVEPAGSFEPIPAGTYAAVITDSDMKDNKAGTGKYLELVIEIIDGEHKGRQVWDRLNLQNPNAKAVEIAQRTLSAICHAVGVMQPKDSGELHNKPMSITVIQEARKDQPGTMSNRIKGYDSTTSAPATNGAPASSGDAQPSMPWNK
jgi:hypothetical protein